MKNWKKLLITSFVLCGFYYLPSAGNSSFTPTSIKKLSPQDQHKRKIAQMIDLLWGIRRYSFAHTLTRKRADGRYEYVPDLLKLIVESNFSQSHYFGQFTNKSHKRILYDYQGNLLTIEQLAEWDDVFSLPVLAEIDNMPSKQKINYPIIKACNQIGISSKILPYYKVAYGSLYDDPPEMDRIIARVENQPKKYPGIFKPQTSNSISENDNDSDVGE